MDCIFYDDDRNILDIVEVEERIDIPSKCIVYTSMGTYLPRFSVVSENGNFLYIGGSIKKADEAFQKARREGIFAGCQTKYRFIERTANLRFKKVPSLITGRG